MGNLWIFILVAIGLGLLLILIKGIRKKRYLIFEHEENINGDISIRYYAMNKRNKNMTPRFKNQKDLVEYLRRRR